MKLTKKDYTKFIATEEYLTVIIEKRAVEQLGAFHNWFVSRSMDLDAIEYFEGKCVVTLANYYCGDTDYEYITLTINDIICDDTEWELSLKKKIKDYEEAKKKEKAEKAKFDIQEAKARKLRKIKELENMLSEETREKKLKELNDLRNNEY